MTITTTTTTTGLGALAAMIHDNAVSKGFWDTPRPLPESIALMHSELSEALEEHRDGRADVYYQIDRITVFPVTDGSGAEWTRDSTGTGGHGTWTGVTTKPEGVAVELIDCLIRILDTLATLDVDIDKVVTDKMMYNAGRPRLHGKAY